MKYALLFGLAMAVTACDSAQTPTPTPTPAPTGATNAMNPVDEPFECPEGMPSYKCEQLKKQNQPGYDGGNGNPPVQPS